MLQHYYLLDTLVLQVNESKTQPLIILTRIHVKGVLELFVAQCTLVKEAKYTLVKWGVDKTWVRPWQPAKANGLP